MQRSKSEQRIITEAIAEWQQTGVLAPEEAARLKATVSEAKNGQAQLAQYFFIIAISCALLAAGALFLDDKLLERLRKSFLLSNYTIAAGAALLSALCFYVAKKRVGKSVSSLQEANLIPGALLAVIALVYACKEWGSGEAYSFFLGVHTLLFMVLALYFRSRVLWLVMLLSACGWLAAVSTAYSHHDLFLGMNYPVRFAVFGACIIGLSLAMKLRPRLLIFQPVTWQAGLLIFYAAFWAVSVFGNYADFVQWQAVRQTQVLIYGILFGAIAATGLAIGIRRDEDALRDYSILFLLLNLYTRYFEYFWDSLNKGLFFLVLALSFGILCRWLFSRAAKKSNNERATMNEQ